MPSKINLVMCLYSSIAPYSRGQKYLFIVGFCSCTIQLQNPHGIKLYRTKLCTDNIKDLSMYNVSKREFDVISGLTRLWVFPLLFSGHRKICENRGSAICFQVQASN